MSDHISTEEAERIAFAIQGRAMEVTGAGELVYDEELRDAADAIRSLAAERDELRVALGEALDTSAECPIHPPCGNCKFCRAFKVYAAALGENQP